MRLLVADRAASELRVRDLADASESSVAPLPLTLTSTVGGLAAQERGDGSVRVLFLNGGNPAGGFGGAPLGNNELYELILTPDEEGELVADGGWTLIADFVDNLPGFPVQGVTPYSGLALLGSNAYTLSPSGPMVYEEGLAVALAPSATDLLELAVDAQTAEPVMRFPTLFEPTALDGDFASGLVFAAGAGASASLPGTGGGAWRQVFEQGASFDDVIVLELDPREAYVERTVTSPAGGPVGGVFAGFDVTYDGSAFIEDRLVLSGSINDTGDRFLLTLDLESNAVLDLVVGPEAGAVPGFGLAGIGRFRVRRVARAERPAGRRVRRRRRSTRSSRARRTAPTRSRGVTPLNVMFSLHFLDTSLDPGAASFTDTFERIPAALLAQAETVGGVGARDPRPPRGAPAGSPGLVADRPPRSASPSRAWTTTAAPAAPPPASPGVTSASRRRRPSRARRSPRSSTRPRRAPPAAWRCASSAATPSPASSSAATPTAPAGRTPGTRSTRSTSTTPATAGSPSASSSAGTRASTAGATATASSARRSSPASRPSGSPTTPSATTARSTSSTTSPARSSASARTRSESPTSGGTRPTPSRPPASATRSCWSAPSRASTSRARPAPPATRSRTPSSGSSTRRRRSSTTRGGASPATLAATRATTLGTSGFGADPIAFDRVDGAAYVDGALVIGGRLVLADETRADGFVTLNVDASGTPGDPYLMRLDSGTLQPYLGLAGEPVPSNFGARERDARPDLDLREGAIDPLFAGLGYTEDALRSGALTQVFAAEFANAYAGSPERAEMCRVQLLSSGEAHQALMNFAGSRRRSARPPTSFGACWTARATRATARRCRPRRTERHRRVTGPAGTPGPRARAGSRPSARAATR